MIALLILLYVLQANQFTIPLGCFVAAWVITCVSVILTFVKGAIDR